MRNQLYQNILGNIMEFSFRFVSGVYFRSFLGHYWAEYFSFELVDALSKNATVLN